MPQHQAPVARCECKRELMLTFKVSYKLLPRCQRRPASGIQIQEQRAPSLPASPCHMNLVRDGKSWPHLDLHGTGLLCMLPSTACSSIYSNTTSQREPADG